MLLIHSFIHSSLVLVLTLPITNQSINQSIDYTLVLLCNPCLLALRSIIFFTLLRISSDRLSVIWGVLSIDREWAKKAERNRINNKDRKVGTQSNKWGNGVSIFRRGVRVVVSEEEFVGWRFIKHSHQVARSETLRLGEAFAFCIRWVDLGFLLGHEVQRLRRLRFNESFGKVIRLRS